MIDYKENRILPNKNYLIGLETIFGWTDRVPLQKFLQ